MINERGIWMDQAEVNTHLFDKPLCDAIAREFRRGSSILDLGCGNGAYVRALTEAGFTVEGYDGSPLTPAPCKVADLSETQDFGLFDVVISLEVGEHIPAKYESTYIDNVCRSARNWIVTSWAVPGQSGVGHVNCRDNQYIIAKYAKRGYKFNPPMTAIFRRDSTLPWFKNTLMVFSKW